MALYPGWQQKIQREMDDAVGHGNAPTIEEITGLKLFNAGWKESFRWNPPVPLGLPTSVSRRAFETGIIFPNEPLSTAT